MNSQRGNENTLYLVTGGAGFMAGHVCRQLIARGDRVRILDLPSAAGLPALPKEAEFVAGDLRGISVLWKNSSGCLRTRKQLSFISPV